MVPAIVIGTPTPAEVATAVWIGLPYSVRIMVDIEPPLTPISDEPKPDDEAVDRSSPTGPAASSPIRQSSLPNSSLTAMIAGDDDERDLEHRRRRERRDQRADARRRRPPAPPRRARTSGSTAPRARCAR